MKFSYVTHIMYVPSDPDGLNDIQGKQCIVC